ncbi:MAG: TVP38/TMEM64 family protein [Candidatus Babeliales bacterium]
MNRLLISRKQLIGLSFLGIIFFIVIYFRLTHFVSLCYLHEHMHTLQYLVAKHYYLSVSVYLTSYIIAMALSLPGSSIFTVAGGLLFGIFFGTCYAIFAATIGATILFLTSRYFIGGWVQQRYKTQLTNFNEEIMRYGHYYLLIVRLVALLPFSLINMLSGLTILPVVTYIWVTLIGLIPISLMYAYAGSKLVFLTSPDELFSPGIASGLILFFLCKIVLVPVFIKLVKYFSKNKQKYKVSKKAPDELFIKNKISEKLNEL